MSVLVNKIFGSCIKKSATINHKSPRITANLLLIGLTHSPLNRQFWTEGWKEEESQGLLR